ncbi:choice-of-anchor I family protein [Paenibacillus sp. GCM10027626]|uniref:choice-of-anchor I family protein n=1 Tax=Paenibacillus sp. GCM10027626 TaxID=3273411 RepID=UPI0036265603
MKSLWNGKRWLALLLSAEMLVGAAAAGAPLVQAEGMSVPYAAPVAGIPYQANGQYDAAVPHVFINQVYGAGLKEASDSYISHGFIELYNPTDSDVSLEGWSLQYADTGSDNNGGVTGDWEKLDLSGTIKKHSSYLIVGKATGAAAPKLDLSGKGDQQFDRYINNKGLKVALVSNQSLLTDSNPFAVEPKPEGYVDLLGTAGNDTGNLIDGYETDFPTGKSEGNSKKLALRRNLLQDTDNNKRDFGQVDYSMADEQSLLLKGPRSSVDGEWGFTPPAFGVVSGSLADAFVGESYHAALAATGGTQPYTYSASGLPAGLAIDASSGVISGIPEAGTEGAATVAVTVTDSATPAAVATKELTLNVRPAKQLEYADQLAITKVGQYVIGTTNEDGGVAEIVKFNKDNGKMYVVNGSGDPPSLDIVPLATNGTVSKEKSVAVKTLSETDGFQFGDLTSVDINTVTKRIAVAVQHADPVQNGRILLLDYDGNLLKSYEAGVQPDMILFTSDGRYLMTADEGEFRSGTIDPKGTVTIVDTTTDEVTHVEFDNPAVIDDLVHIRGAVDPATGLISGKGTKEEAVTDLEPEFIVLSADESKAYVALQENNAIAMIDIASKSVLSVKGLGYKDLSDPRNALDLVKDGVIKLENVPFYGMYMPDGIASRKINGTQYLFTANEGDATDWPGRKNVTTVKKLKSSLNPASKAAQFLQNTTVYDGVEVVSDMGNDDVYMFGGRSFSIWNADTMEQVYDSASDFEQITAERLPQYFNASHTNTTLDSRSPKKGPEPEYVALGEVGSKVFAFTGLERIGGVMTYDVTDPEHPTFINYTNTRDFTKGLETDTGPEGLEFIAASDNPTGRPLLLVANEVGGTVIALQLQVTKVTLDKQNVSLRVGGQGVKLHASVDAANPAGGALTWSSSDPAVAKVDQGGFVTAAAEGKATIRALSADGLGMAEATVTVSAAGAEDGSWQLTVMHTNDTHAHLADAARRATLVKQVRNETDNNLLLDAGDVFSGDLYFTKWFGQADLAMMNEMGYDAMTFGNHEFDQGTKPLAEFVRGAKFPIVSANIDFSKDDNMKALLKAPQLIDTAAPKSTANAGVYPYVVLDVNGHQVGVFGLTTEDTAETSSPGKNVAFNEAAAAAEKTVAELKNAGIDVIIALSHLGYGRDKELAGKVKGIDLIVGGHTHTQLNAPEVVDHDGEPTVIVQANEWGKFLGRVDLTIDEHGVVQTEGDQLQGSLLPVNATVAEDEAARQLLAPYNAELEELKKQVVGKTAVVLNGERKDVRSRETNLGNFIADGMLAWGKEKKGADIALMNGGGIRASIDEGEITMGELRTVMPFGNTLFVLDVTGEALKEGLENGVSGAKLTDLPGKFPQVAGMRFKWDPNAAAGNKVYDVEIRKGSAYVPLDLQATYRLATNSFVANGGDGYASFAKAIEAGAYHEDLGDPDYEIFIAHMKSLGGTIEPKVEGRIVEQAKAETGGNNGGGSGWIPPVTVKPEEKPAPQPETGRIELSGDALQVAVEKDAAGQTINLVTVKPDALQQALTKAAAAGKPEIFIRAAELQDGTMFQLPAGVLAPVSGKGSKLIITVDTALGSYSLPLHVLEKQSLTDGAHVQISIKPAADELLQELQARAKAMGATLASDKAIVFEVAIVSGGKEQALENFGRTYVGRMIYLASSAKPGLATAVLYDQADKSFRFVPGTGATLNGKPAIEMKRPGNSVYTALYYTKAFEDLNGHWAKSEVELLASKLIVNGVNERQFAPGREMTRAEFAALLVRGLGLNPDRGGAAAFADVASNSWYEGAIGAALKAGIITGVKADQFAPNAVITRAEMAVMAVRALEFATQGGQARVNQTGGKFADQAAIPQWAAAQAALLADRGIMQGNGKGQFAPAELATRAQAAAVVLRTLQELQFVGK